MKRFDYLTPVAFVVMAVAFFLSRSEKMPLPGKLDYYLIAGGVMILAHLVLRGQDIAKSVGIRQMRYGSNSIVLSLAVLAALIGVNYLAFRHSKRWDLTKSQRFSLSDQTRKVVTGLKEDIKITYFQSKLQIGAGRDRLSVYEALSPHVKVEFVDPLANPVKAQAFEARGPWPTLFFERGARKERIGSDSEQDITNALIKVTRDSKKTVCFQDGEGERDSDDANTNEGLGRFKAALQKASYETKKLTLIRETAVPATCVVYVVAGPAKDLLPPVVDALRDYVKGGGKLLFMVEPEQGTPFTNIAALLKEWGIEAGNNVVLDVSPMGQMLGTGPLTPVVTQYPAHDITKDFRVMTVLHTARTMKAASGTPEGITAQNLLETSNASWGETDLALKDPRPDPQDMQGPLPVAAVATIKGAAPAPVPGSDTPAASVDGRVVAYGDVDFATNQLLSMQGNQDLALNTVAWLSQDPDLISIRPPDAETNRLFLTQGQQQLVMALSLFVLPGAFVLGGIFSWWRRRG